MTPRLTWSCGASSLTITSTASLIKDHWSQVMGTFDGTTLRLYLNGSQASSKALASATTCKIAGQIGMGGDAASSTAGLAGRLDEVAVYAAALSAGQIYDAYLYQAGWVEDRQSRNLTVDTDNPSVEVVVADPPYQANWPSQVLVTAEDATSEVDKVQLCVGTSDCSSAAERRTASIPRALRRGARPSARPHRASTALKHGRPTGSDTPPLRPANSFMSTTARPPSR